MRRSTLSTAFLAILLAGLASCDEPEPFVADMRMICRAGQSDPGLPPEMRRMQGFREIADKIKTAEAARLMAEVARAAPAEHAALLAPALARAKLSRCPFFER